MPDSTFDVVAALREFELFQGIPDEALKRIRAVPTSQPIKPGVLLFRQDAVIRRLFLVKRGQVTLLRRDEGQRELWRVVNEGEVLGRLRLDIHAPQLGDARAAREVELISIDVKSLVTLASHYPAWGRKFDRARVAGRLRAIPYFAPLTNPEIDWLSDLVKFEDIPRGRVLAEENAPVKDVMIVRQGRVHLQSNLFQREWWRSSNSVLGLRVVFTGGYYKCRIVAETKVSCYRVPKVDFVALTERHPQNVWTREPIDIELMLSRAPFFKMLTRPEIRYLAGYVMQVYAHRPGTKISRSQQPDPHYRILTRGEARKYTYNSIGVPEEPEPVMPGFTWGEKNIMQQNQLAEITVEATTPVSWLQIHYLDFQAFSNAHPEIWRRKEAKLHMLASVDAVASTALQPEEGPLFRKRRHPIVLVKRLLIPVLVALLYLAILISLSLLGIHFSFWLKFLPVLLWLLIMGGWAIADYRNDYFTITHTRIMHEEAVPLMSERQNAAPIDKIQNSHMERGFFAKMLGYGQLYISTAAEEGEIKFDYLAHPDEIIKILSGATERIKLLHAQMEEPEDYIKRYLRKELDMETDLVTDVRALMEDVEVRTAGSAPTYNKVLGWLRAFLKSFSSSKPRLGERLIWRKHWFGLLVKSFLPLGLAIGAIVLFFVIRDISRNTPYATQIRNGALLLAFPLLIGGILWLVWQWVDWRNDFYIVTDHFIEQVNKKPLGLQEDRIKLSLERVENVEFQIPHFIAYIFNYGNVSIQTAATKGNIEFYFVPDPKTVHADIFSRIEKQKINAAMQQSKRRDEEMAKWVKAYHELMAERAQQERPTS
jgi:CRP-like cAMP-binding protein/uncharacterized membrane protein YdbT with pleckstrin-like domain